MNQIQISYEAFQDLHDGFLFYEFPKKGLAYYLQSSLRSKIERLGSLQANTALKVTKALGLKIRTEAVTRAQPCVAVNALRSFDVNDY